MEKTISSQTEELNRTFNEVLHWFFAYPTIEVTLNELSKETKTSKTTAKRIVDELIKTGFLDRIVIGRLWRIRANQGHQFFKTIKIPYNLNLVYNTGILDLINQQMPNARAIILFGSYRKGDDIPTSDLDIAVEVIGDQPLRVYILGVIKKFGYRENVKVNVHVFSRNHIDLNVFANIANGILLQGFLEVRP